MFNSINDVVKFAKTFGRGALDYAVNNGTLNNDQIGLIRSAIKFAESTRIEIESFNDGNNEWSIWATYEVSVICGNIVSSSVSDVIVNRRGFGSFTAPFFEADLTNEQRIKVINAVKEKNEAYLALIA